MKKKEAVLLGYKFLYNKSGQLITERTTTDITKLKKFLKKYEYELLQVIMREGTAKLDAIHSDIENHINARKMTD
jgi:hypothetical protein|tara:strand:- start:1628 stop:1852 length:225 start_codon:yes stop_codon:yes gene_type:complete